MMNRILCLVPFLVLLFWVTLEAMALGAEAEPPPLPAAPSAPDWRCHRVDAAAGRPGHSLSAVERVRQAMDSVIEDMLAGRDPRDWAVSRRPQDSAAPRWEGDGGVTAAPPTTLQGGLVISYSGRLNLNTATPAQLSLLPGIGETRARAIAAHRVLHPFGHPRHILRVDGIGWRRYVRIRPYLAVEGPSDFRKIVAVVDRPEPGN